MPSLNTTTLDGKPVLDPPAADFVNWFASSTGAGRYGHGLFLLSADDYATLKDKKDPVKLVMRDQAGDSGGLSINVLVASAVPYCPAVGSDKTDKGVVAVRVVDLRFGKDAETFRSFNVQDGFKYSGDTGDPPDFVAGTKSGSSEYTWAGLVTALELPALVNAPAWKPRNAAFNGWPLHRVVDWVAAELFTVVGWDYETDKFTWHAPGVKSDATDEGLSEATRIGGGDGHRNTARLPAKFSVRFQAGGTRSYAKTVDVGGQGGKVALQVGMYIAASAPEEDSSDDYEEQDTLDAVAADLADRAYKFLSVDPGLVEYAGIVPLNPDGLVREVLWHSGGSTGPAHLQGARTKVLKGVRFDWLPASNGGLAGFADPGLAGVPAPRHEPVSDQLVVGIGGVASSVGPSGTRYVWGGGGLPKGTGLYQVLTTVDETYQFVPDHLMFPPEDADPEDAG